MKFEAIYHRTSNHYCYPVNTDELQINIQTGKDILKVFLIHGDPFEAGILGGDWKWEGEEIEILDVKQLKYHQWWSIQIKPPFKRCRYYFKLVAKQETSYFFEDGFYSKNAIREEHFPSSCFIYPWMNAIDVNETPAWVNQTVWYQIFPERFANGNVENDPVGSKPWESGYQKVGNDEFYGGDLEGIIQRLDYLSDLGITGIYLTPVFLSNTSHKYDTKDYKIIDPHFGNEEILKRLVQKAHESGMKIMLDGVFNHTGKEFAPWQDVLERGKRSKYFDWFMINDWPVAKNKKDTRDGSFYSFAFYANMPKLNTNNREVRNYLLSIVREWIVTYDIDALRLDVANELSHRFCKELREMAKKIKPDFYILGEIWHDGMEWLRGDEFDGVMNYPLGKIINGFWFDGKKSSYDFEEEVNKNLIKYMTQTNEVMFNLLDSHDTNRLINKVKSIDVFYQQLALLFTMYGSSCIYYGTEIAMEGNHDPDCRRCMPWDQIDEGNYASTIRNVKKLIELRHLYPDMRSQELQFIHYKDYPRVLHYKKGESIEVVINAMDISYVIQSEANNIVFKYKYVEERLQSGGILIINKN